MQLLLLDMLANTSRKPSVHGLMVWCLHYYLAPARPTAGTAHPGCSSPVLLELYSDPEMLTIISSIDSRTAGNYTACLLLLADWQDLANTHRLQHTATTVHAD